MKNSNVSIPVAVRRAATTGAVVIGAFVACGTAHAQSTTPTAPSNGADSLTWNGITLYGTVDIGLQNQTHGAPISDYYPAGSNASVQKYGNASATGLTPSNLSQSRIGLSGNEPLLGDWAGVFRLETFFNPQSGNITDGLKSLTVNNGKALSAWTAASDSSTAGQLFQVSYLGLSSPSYGTVTFGRQSVLLADGVSRYDATGAAQAFSLLGASGATGGGGGATEDKRLDQTLKYTAKFAHLHVGALYQFSGSNGSKNTAFQAQLGADFAGFSGDLYYDKKYDAVNSAPLSVKQVAQLAGLCNPKPAVPPVAPQCYSVSNSLVGTISDNTVYAAMALYKLPQLPLTVYAGYQHISFDNPTNPLPAGSVIIGGYQLAFVNNTAYGDSKVLQVYWAGARYGITPDIDLSLSYYGLHQNAYSTDPKFANCSTQVSTACSGTGNGVSFLGDWRLSRRFDVYAGTFWTEVKDGLASGYYMTSNNLTSTASDITTTVGARFRF